MSTMEILFATDGRPPATAAGELLKRLADPSRVRVTILSAQDLADEGPDRFLDMGVEEAEGAMRDAGIGVQMLRMTGDPAVCIEKTLAEDDYGLVVLGAGNHSWLGRLAFGSVSTHMLHASVVPILVVHRAPDPSHERLHVLVGGDGSASAAHAIDTLASVTEPNRVELSVRTVVHTPELGFSAHPGAYIPTRYIEDLLATEKAVAKRHLSETLDRSRVMGFGVHGSLGTGWPGNDLLHHGETKEADLIVVGARGLGAVARMTMGSVSAHVARFAPAALVAHAPVHLADSEVIEEPDGHVSGNRYPIKWG
jgi:nucleotide-binding universal stress UspA family protein